MGRFGQENWSVFIYFLTKFLNIDVALCICTKQNAIVLKYLDRKWLFPQISDCSPPQIFQFIFRYSEKE